MVTIGNNTVLIYLKVPKTVDFKCFHHKKVNMWGDGCSK